MPPPAGQGSAVCRRGPHAEPTHSAWRPRSLRLLALLGLGLAALAGAALAAPAFVATAALLPGLLLAAAAAVAVPRGRAALPAPQLACYPHLRRVGLLPVL